MSWQKIGEVVDAVGSGRKQLLDGKEYDYVFDVDIQDGVPPLKLPYNANGKRIESNRHLAANIGVSSENPYNAAQRFLASNDLPMSYLDQVVQFIEKNTSGVSLSSGSEYSDPYTGELIKNSRDSDNRGPSYFEQVLLDTSRRITQPLLVTRRHSATP